MQKSCENIEKNSHLSRVASHIARDTSGDAVVEATILFPIMIMIFAALVLIAMYLPTQAVLQRATQYAATALATEESDTWLFFDEDSFTYNRENNRSNLPNVYVSFFTNNEGLHEKGEAIVIEFEKKGLGSRAGNLKVTESYIINRLLYKEAVVTATKEITMPVNLSFIGFPEKISLTATSVAIVPDGDEFIRNVDMASDFLDFIIDKYDLHEITDTISSFGKKVSNLLGW
ncbi:MAG: hypothetical protein FWD05_01120 [Oscillospiraceae bacterium]|nr:hypothetical protein [Oscillospiraceae bacterium]